MWRARVAPDHAGVYRQHFTDEVMPKLHGIGGFISGHVLERRLADRVELLVMTEWASWDSIRQFAGDDPGRAVVDPHARQMLLEYDETVEHFERS